MIPPSHYIRGSLLRLEAVQDSACASWWSLKQYYSSSCNSGFSTTPAYHIIRQASRIQNLYSHGSSLVSKQREALAEAKTRERSGCQPSFAPEGVGRSDGTKPAADPSPVTTTLKADVASGLLLEAVASLRHSLSAKANVHWQTGERDAWLSADAAVPRSPKSCPLLLLEEGGKRDRNGGMASGDRQLVMHRENEMESNGNFLKKGGRKSRCENNAEELRTLLLL